MQSGGKHDQKAPEDVANWKREKNALYPMKHDFFLPKRLGCLSLLRYLALRRTSTSHETKNSYVSHSYETNCARPKNISKCLSKLYDSFGL